MNADSPRSSRREGALLLADISGYTRFLQGVADAHRDLIVEADEPPAAYAVLSHLLDTMVVAIAPPFRLAKFEGDAIFAISGNGAADGQAVIDVVERCHAAFRGELSRAGSQWICSCAACAVVGELDVKFVVHHGAYVHRSHGGWPGSVRRQAASRRSRAPAGGRSLTLFVPWESGGDDRIRPLPAGRWTNLRAQDARSAC